MWELDYKESWGPKNWCFWTVVLEKTFESPLDCKEIKSVNHKGNQSWIFFGRTESKAETPILWPPDVKNWHLKIHWCWEILTAGGEGDSRGWNGWMASPTQWTWVWVNSRSLVMDREVWHAAVYGFAKSWTRLSDWTELNWKWSFPLGSVENTKLFFDNGIKMFIYFTYCQLKNNCI